MSDLDHLYRTKRWARVRQAQLVANPLCKFCLEQGGQITPATICDHVEPHRGDLTRFWTGALQSLCQRHHSGAKSFFERNGYWPGIGADGYPLDKVNHPSYRASRASRG